MFGVLGQGLLRGVAIGAVISLVLLIRRAALPPVALLGRIPGTRRFSDRERHPENEAIPGLLILRPGASLLYFNMNYVRDTIEERVRAEKETQLVVLDLSEVSIVDMHAAEMLRGSAHELAAKGIKIQAVEAHSQVRDRLRRESLEERLGGIKRMRTSSPTWWTIFWGRGSGRIQMSPFWAASRWAATFGDLSVSGSMVRSCWTPTDSESG